MSRLAPAPRVEVTHHYAARILRSRGVRPATVCSDMALAYQLVRAIEGRHIRLCDVPSTPADFEHIRAALAALETSDTVH